MNEWLDELMDLSAADEPAVLVTVAGIRGSAPRELGAKMIVTERETIGTIGGGQLEYQSTRVAVEMLQDEQMALRSFRSGRRWASVAEESSKSCSNRSQAVFPAGCAILPHCTGSAGRRCWRREFRAPRRVSWW